MKILLAVDASKFSQAAIQAVVRGFRTGTEVRVLHVLEPVAAYMSADLFPHFVSHIAKLEEDRRKQAQQMVKDIAVKLRKAGFRATELVDSGGPKSTIIERAAEWKADLIVLGSHGLKGLNRLLMGSVSEAVVRHAPCSVQVVRIRGIFKRTRRSRHWVAISNSRGPESLRELIADTEKTIEDQHGKPRPGPRSQQSEPGHDAPS